MRRDRENLAAAIFPETARQHSTKGPSQIATAGRRHASRTPSGPTREQIGGLKGGSERAAQHPHQPAVANLFQMDRWKRAQS